MEKVDEAMLAHICDDDPLLMREARHNKKYRDHLIELKLEEDIEYAFGYRYKLTLENVYASEVQINWKKFSEQVESFSGVVNPSDCIDGIYFLLKNAANEIRSFTSSKPGWENIWSEQVYNQISSVINSLMKDIKPALIAANSHQELSRSFDQQYEKLRERFKEYCTPDDSYWMTVIDNIELPLRKALNITNGD